MKFKKTILAAMVGGATLLAGCGKAPNFSDEFIAIGENKGYTKDQMKAGLVPQFREEHMKVVIDEDTGEKRYEPNYKNVTLERLLKQNEKEKLQLDRFLEYNISRMSDETWLERRGTRKRLESRKEKLDFKVRRLKRIINFQKFMSLMNQNSENLEKINQMTREYHTGLFYPGEKIDNMTKIEAEYVKLALSKDLIEHKTIFSKNKIKKKNPEFPHKDKIKKEVWEWVKIGYELNGYDLDLDDTIDYIEIFRKRKDGTSEDKPAIVVYQSYQNPDVVVIDLDKEGELGYGEIDLVEQIYSVTSGREFIENYGKYLTKLSEEKKKNEIPIIGKNRVEIIEVGELEEKLWQTNMDNGYNVPYTYKNKDYNLMPKFGKSEESFTSKKSPHKIELFKKTYKGHERVIEFYKLKPEFADKEFMSVTVVDNETVKLEYENGEFKWFKTNAMIENKPFKIAYNLGSKFRDVIENKDGKDKPVYESRKRNALPKLE